MADDCNLDCAAFATLRLFGSALYATKASQ